MSYYHCNIVLLSSSATQSSETTCKQFDTMPINPEHRECTKFKHVSEIKTRSRIDCGVATYIGPTVAPAYPLSNYPSNFNEVRPRDRSPNRARVINKIRTETGIPLERFWGNETGRRSRTRSLYTGNDLSRDR